MNREEISKKMIENVLFAFILNTASDVNMQQQDFYEDVTIIYAKIIIYL